MYIGFQFLQYSHLQKNMWPTIAILAFKLIQSSNGMNFTGAIVVAPGSNFVPPQVPSSHLVGMD